MKKRPTKIPHNKRITLEKKPSRIALFKGMDWGRARLWGVGVFFALLWVALWGRAYQIQIIKGPELSASAKRQHTVKETIAGLRGNIMDRNGSVLARSVDSSSVWINPKAVEDRQMTAAVLGKILEVPPAQIMSRLNVNKRFVWLVRKVNDTVARQIKEAALPGVHLDPEFERIYPYKTLAGQLLGFVNVDDAGIEGLEKAYENRLGGMRIKQVVLRDAAGRRLGAHGSDNGDLRGKDVRLTIDTQVQFFAEESLAEYVEKYGAKWGGCIVVDVPTGEVLAWAQFPFFDPNAPGAYPEGIRRNRLASDALEQGSTIKSFLIAAALEERVVTPDSKIDCQGGRWKIGRETIHDTHSYGELAVSRVLHVSSNIGVAKIAFSLGAKKYHSYLQRLGFGQPTSLPLAGQSRGILRRAEKWQDIDTASAAFGQSFSATLAQMGKAYLCLASNGEVRELKLTLDDDLPSLDGADLEKQPPKPLFSARTVRTVRNMLREVVEEEGGTGKQARIPGIVVGGKTGTAQKADRSGRYGAGRVGSFVGMVPIDKPRYLICVLLDEPSKNQYGGVVAAPIFRDVALRTMAYHGHLPDSDDPLVRAIAEKETSRRMKAGLVAEQQQGPQRKVTRITAPSRAAKAEAEKLRTARKNAQPIPEAKRVPPVVGLGIKRATEIFVAQGVMPVFKGKGAFVAKQEPSGGSPWPADKQSCVLWLEEAVH